MKKAIVVPELTRLSSKGQIVIPNDIRKKLHVQEGSIFGVVAKDNTIILKKIDTKAKAEDMRTLKLVEESWKDIEEGRYKRTSVEDFFKELSKWKKSKK